jgi:hypothetical protein
MPDWNFFCGKLLGTLSPQKLGLVLFFPFPWLTLFALSAKQKLILSIIFSLVARVAWRQSLWPLDSQPWCSLSPPNWIKGIIHPHLTFGIPKPETHLFQIFAMVLCDLLWFSRNKAVHEGIIPNILQLADTIKKTALAHSAAWKSPPVPLTESWTPLAIGSFKINFDTAIRDNFSA